MATRRWQFCWLIGAVLLLAIPAAGQSPTPKSLEIYYFYSPTCRKCMQVTADIQALPSRFPGRVTIQRHDITQLHSQNLLRRLDREYRNSAPTPKVYFGKTVLAGVDQIKAELIPAVKRELQAPPPILSVNAPPPPVTESRPATLPAETQPAGEDDRSELVEYFETFTWFSVAAAGLIDGINPCAFTTIVFLVSMLAFLGKRRGEVLQIGFGFVLGVFVTYFLLGLGALKAIKEAAVYSGLYAWLSWAVAMLAFGLAAWSLWDTLRIVRTGRPEAASLGLPEKTVKRIHTLIRSQLTTGGMLIGAFILGVGISLLESVCTGQVYLPTLMLIHKVAPDYRLQQWGFLLAYNLAFILPLVVVLALAAWGVGSQKIASLFRKHMAAVKLLMAILFVFLGVAVLWSL